MRNLGTWKYSYVILCATLLLMAANIAHVSAQRKKRVAPDRSPRQELKYDNHHYLPTIRSSQLHPLEHEAGFPVWTLGSGEMLQLSFDDLRGDIRNYYYSIEHCNANWESSNLSPLEYAEGYNEDRIIDYSPSVNTLKPYTNYRATLPSAQVRPKLPGNYLLKVYEDADKRRLVLTRRFYVVNPLISVHAAVKPSPNGSNRLSHQKIDLVVKPAGIQLSDPFRNLRVLVMQNQRPDVHQWLRQPSFVGQQELRYQDLQTLDFPGGNEFRFLDLRSLKLGSENIATFSADSIIHAHMKVDEALRGQAYGSVFDENGAFFIRNTDRPDALDEADYALVHFRLSLDGEEHAQALDGRVYLVGGFNFFERSRENQLTYNADSKMWEVDVLLKQGLYDYDFVLANSAQDSRSTPTIDPFYFSGSHFQTGNDYQILVYYRRPGTTWDELVGFQHIETGN